MWSLCWNPGNERLATCSEDQTTKLWDTSDWKWCVGMVVGVCNVVVVGVGNVVVVGLLNIVSVMADILRLVMVILLLRV